MKTASTDNTKELQKVVYDVSLMRSIKRKKAKREILEKFAREVSFGTQSPIHIQNKLHNGWN